uniref:Lipid-A-disaccharide synthase n=1 Tax=candidate division WOR-3 bacterium TaxID=2052148 RepID=A0A7V3RI21_UNCW3
MGTFEIKELNFLNSNSSIFICACEPSGDLYGSLFVKNYLYNRCKRIFGVGGEDLKNAGVSLIYDYHNLKTFGFTLGLSAIIKNIKMYRMIARSLFQIKPDFFIPVAYPGINLLLCRYAKRLKIKVIYLLPPQLWIWGSFRKYFIKKWVDIVVSVIPFEYHFYKQKKIRVTYWLNPLLKELKKYQRDDYTKRIGFMPGSRTSEIKRNLPVIIELISHLQNKYNLEYSIILHPDTSNSKTLNKLRFLPNVKLIVRERYREMRNCDLIVTCSGTASLECSIMEIPQIFFNRPGFLDYYVFRHLFNIDEYNLVNLYYRKKIVPVFVMRKKEKLRNLMLQELENLLRKMPD